MGKSRSFPAFQGEEAATGSFFKVWMIEVLSEVAVLNYLVGAAGRFPPLKGNRYRNSYPVPVKAAFWQLGWYREISISSLRGLKCFLFTGVIMMIPYLIEWAFYANLGGTAEFTLRPLWDGVIFCVEGGESMFGISDPQIILAYVLCLLSSGLCVVYGISNWSKDS